MLTKTDTFAAMSLVIFAAGCPMAEQQSAAISPGAISSNNIVPGTYAGRVTGEFECNDNVGPEPVEITQAVEITADGQVFIDGAPVIQGAVFEFAGATQVIVDVAVSLDVIVVSANFELIEGTEGQQRISIERIDDNSIAYTEELSDIFDPDNFLCRMTTSGVLRR